MKFPTNYIKNDKLIDYIEKLIQSGSFYLLLSGKPGCGKTEIASIVFDAIYEKHENNSKYAAVRMSAQAMYRDYLSAINDNEDRAKKVNAAESFMLRDLVMVDDLGGELDTVAASNYFANLFCRHYDAVKNGENNVVIITTNLDLDGISKIYGLRVMDRISELFHIIQMTNPSWRQRQVKMVRF